MMSAQIELNDVSDSTFDEARYSRFEREWPNFPKVDDPLLWMFRSGMYLNGCYSTGRPDFAAKVAERRTDADGYLWGEPYAWDGEFCRWIWQLEVFENATDTQRPWIISGIGGCVDHFLTDCPIVTRSEKRGERWTWGLGLLDVTDEQDVCGWCRRVWFARLNHRDRSAA